MASTIGDVVGGFTNTVGRLDGAASCSIGDTMAGALGRLILNVGKEIKDIRNQTEIGANQVAKTAKDTRSGKSRPRLLQYITIGGMDCRCRVPSEVQISFKSTETITLPSTTSVFSSLNMIFRTPLAPCKTPGASLCPLYTAMSHDIVPFVCFALMPAPLVSNSFKTLI